MKYLTANEIRSRFLDFFKSKGHTIVASDSVVPKDDPTVLFTTAGMQQFKRQFLGNIDSYTRAATSQKCIRTDDLDVVGKTNCHHTFFEMLGNFSFGDYFKNEAIHWAWEFLTQILEIPKERLWVSVYQDDQEAFEIWKNAIGIPEHKIFKLGDKSNFWPSNAKQNGPNGPCGPCSEIFFDYDPSDPAVPKDPDDIAGRFTEVWNLVFTQFNRKDGGILEPLPSKNIDTGMGLERLCSVMQGVKNNFETDLFAPVITAIEREIPGNLSVEEQRIIADHVRAATFAISDGIIPSNKERGSVVKSLINRSINLVLKNGGEEKPCVYRLVPVIATIMGTQYPELLNKADHVSKLIEKTEEAFIQVWQLRVPELKERMAHNPDPEELGALFFLYQDTYGVPIATSSSIALSCGISATKIDAGISKFQALMEEQRERSRAGSKMAGEVFVDMDLDLNVPRTQFLGYKTLHSEAKILRIFKGQDSVSKAIAGEQIRVVLDQTPFYAESGGQVGDSGEILARQGKPAKLTVTDTQKIDDVFLHTATVEEGQVRVNDSVEALVDESRRLSIMRNHTSTHLLQAALRKVLGEHVQQQGSVVDENRLRFDFTHPQGLSQQERDAVEAEVNRHVRANIHVEKNEMTMTEAREKGALAFFAEKYGQTVRVIHVPGCSTELCGGTHLDNTGEIKLFKIISESAIAQGIRRIEATTASLAEAVIKLKEQQAKEDAEKQKTKEKSKELQQQAFEALKADLDSIIERSKDAKSVRVITHTFEAIDINMLRNLSDIAKQKAKSCAVVFASKSEDRGSLIVALTDDLVKAGISAQDIVKTIAPVMHGSGGGRAQFAQAGSKETAYLPQALREAERLLTEQLIQAPLP